jgi:ATP-dependent DNA helicase RecG
LALVLTEGRSTDVPQILRAMKANGSPQPKFRTGGDHRFLRHCVARL